MGAKFSACFAGKKRHYSLVLQLMSFSSCRSFIFCNVYMNAIITSLHNIMNFVPYSYSILKFFVAVLFATNIAV